MKAGKQGGRRWTVDGGWETVNGRYYVFVLIVLKSKFYII